MAITLGLHDRLMWHAVNLKGLVTTRLKDLPVPPPMSAPDGVIRLYIGPANYAGQGNAWAHSVERWMPNAAAANMAIQERNDSLRYPAHYRVFAAVYAGSGRWNQGHLDAMRGFTHVLIEAFIPNVRSRGFSDVRREVEWLTRSGVAVGWMCHGTEIRLPSRHRALEPWSPYVGDCAPAYEDRRVLRNLSILETSDLPVFVSTPDLLIDVPTATWCPVVVDAERLRPETTPFGNEWLRVLHSPSHRSIKGTDLVLPTLKRLEEEGLVSLDLVEGVPNAEMVARLASADVVVDQFRIGSYGVAACEAMAAGRVVVGHVNEQVRRAVRQHTGLDLPVVEATPDSLESVLRGLHGDRRSAKAVAEKGPRFVCAVHDGRLSVEALRSFLTNVPARRAGPEHRSPGP